MKRIITALFVVIAVLSVSLFSFAESPQEEFNRALALFNEGQKRFNVSDFKGINGTVPFIVLCL